MRQVLGVLLVLCVAVPALGQGVPLDLSSGFNMDVIAGAKEFQAIQNYAAANDPDKDLQELQGNLAEGVGWWSMGQGTMLICATSDGGFGEPYSIVGNHWHPGWLAEAEGLPEDGVITGSELTYHIASHLGNATYSGDWTEVASPTAGPPASIPNMATKNNAMYVYSLHSKATGQVISTTATLPVAQQGRYASINFVLGASGSADGARNMQIVAVYSDLSEEVLYSFSTDNVKVGPCIDDSITDVYDSADFNVVEQGSKIYNNGGGATGSISDDANSLFEFADPLALNPGKVLMAIRLEDQNPSLNWSARGMTIFGATATELSPLQAAAYRLVDLQNDDGGWDWPLDDGSPANSSPTNTVGPIAKGLAMVYTATDAAGLLPALQQAGGFLLAKTNNFSPSDGYLAAQLDEIFGGTTYRDHLTANFYGPLAAGTYDKNGDGTLYDTAGYVNLIRTARASGGIANLAAWDVGMGLVGAASCGASTAEWIAGVKGEIDELDGAEYYDVIGLAGAVYGLAFVGEDYDPVAGEHAAASSLGDLADILASYQIAESGGFAWSSAYVIPNDSNETIQETAYATMALDAVDRSAYRAAILAAGDYMVSVQLGTGGWENYATSGENNEVTAEGAWGVALAQQSEATLTLDVPTAPDPLYVQPGETVVVDLNIRDLLVEVSACQAIMAYETPYLTLPVVAAGGGVWDELIYDQIDSGDVDVAVGVLHGNATTGTVADGTVAKLTFQAVNTPGLEAATDVVFRADVDDIESTFLSDMEASAVYPDKVNSQAIIIDGVNPLIDIVSVTQGSGDMLAGDNAIQGVVNISVDASDAWAGLDGVPTVTVTPNGGTPEAADYVDESPAGTFNYTWTVTATTPNGTAVVDASVSDMAGNSASDSGAINVNKNQITGIVELEGLVDGVSRDVVFVVTGATRAEWTVTVGPFAGNQAAFQLDDVPDGATGLSAKTAWNLREKLAVALDLDGQIVNADFVGDGAPGWSDATDHYLRGGDLNGTNSINILDYTIMKINWAGSAPEADINGDGVIATLDYTIMKLNWVQIGDAE